MKKNNSKPVLPDDFESRSEIDRRSFLEYSLKLSALMAAAPVLKQSEALAQVTADRPTRFVHFMINSGSCQLSNYLCPTAGVADLSSLNSVWKANPGIATSFRPTTSSKQTLENVDPAASNKDRLYHARTQVGSYYMPLLWDSYIPVGTSGTTKMKNLISGNCAMIYGLQSSPAHPLAQTMMLDPEPGACTVGGYISNSTTKSFFAALGNYSGVRPFKSPNGSGLRIFNANPSASNEVLSAVLPKNDETLSQARRDWLAGIGGKVKNALESIRVTNMGLKPGISELYYLLADAQTAVDQKTYAAVSTDFDATVLKYKALLARVKTMAATSIQGITDQNYSLGNTTYRTYENTKVMVQNPRDAFTGSYYVSDEFAYIFAFVETALRNNLSNVLQIGLGEGMVTLNIQGNGQISGNAFDNHTRGVSYNLLFGAFFYYAFNTFLYELKRNIQGITSDGSSGSLPVSTLPNLINELSSVTSPTPTPAPSPWRDTVIVLNSEFPRNPRIDGTGSDHGYNAANITILSGRLAGNLKIYGSTTYGERDGNAAYAGTWGRGAESMKYSGNYMNTKDVGACLANLFVRGSTHPGLQTLLDRSAKLFYIDSTGNIVFDSTLIQNVSLG